MRNCRIFRILSRLSILLVIIGFFQPVACGFSGPEIVQYSLEEGPLPIIVSSVLLLLSFFISIIMILRIRKKKREGTDCIPYHNFRDSASLLFFSPH